MAYKITKDETTFIAFSIGFGLFLFLVSAGIRDYILATIGNGPKQIIIGLIGLALLAYFLDIRGFKK